MIKIKNKDIEIRYEQLKKTWKNLVNANIELLDENKILKEDKERLTKTLEEIYKKASDRNTSSLELMKYILELKGSDSNG